MTLVIDAAASAADGTSPWAKLGDVVFRASLVESHLRLTLTTRPGGDDVVAALEALRPTTFNNRSRRLTWAGRSLTGRVVSVSRAETEPGADLDVVFERRPEQNFGHAVRGGSFSTSTGTHTSDEMLRLAVRRLLFGEPNPLGAFSPKSPIRDFLADLPDTGLPDPVHEAAFGLLATEALNESGLEVLVTRVEVSPPGPDGRRVHLAWTSRDSTGSRAGTSVEIEGVVAPRPAATGAQRAERLVRSRRWPPLPGQSAT